MSVQVEQVAPTTGKGTVRSHDVLIDRPVEKGGADAGPMGGELMLLSLAGCFLSNLLAAVASRSADVSAICIDVTGTVGGVPERFEAIDMHVRARYSDPQAMRKLVSIAERGCLVTNTLRDAVVLGISIDGAQP